MEKKKLTLRSLPFLSGVISGGLLFGLFLLISGSKSPDPPVQTNSLSLSSAKIYFHQYLSKQPLHIDTLKGIAIDLDQLNAMKSILDLNPKVKGFRIYFGLDNVSNRIGIVVGIDNMGHDDLTNIMQTSRTYDPCPPICDSPSQIY